MQTLDFLPALAVHYENSASAEPLALRRGPSGVRPSPPCALCCMRGRRPGLYRNKPGSSRGCNRHTTLGQSHAQRCRIRGICERPDGHKALGCGGRPARRTDRHWPTQTRSRSARLGFGRAESARGGAGCRAWTLHPLARPRVNELALGVQWRAWGGASVGWVPDDAVFTSSFVHLVAVNWQPNHS